MRNRPFAGLALLLFAGLVLLAACASGDEPVAVEGEETVCVEPAADQMQLVREEQGYCLLYPASHTVIDMESGAAEVVVGELMNHIDPRLSVNVEDLAGRTLDQVVADFLSGYEGFSIAQSELTLDGQPAIMLDGIPGQDYYRMLFTAHDGQLYRLSVAPFDANQAETLPQAQAVYDLLLASFRFVKA